MHRRYVLAGLAVVAALSLVATAVGGINPVAGVSITAKKLGGKAFKKAKKANRNAGNAQKTANTAQTTANKAATDLQTLKTNLGSIVERSDDIPVVMGSQNNTTVNCLAGEVPIGGGGSWATLNTGAILQQSHRVGNGWNVGGASALTANTLTVKVYCLKL